MSVAKSIVFTLLCSAILGFGPQANAQGLFGGKTFGQRLDDLGRTLFGTGPEKEAEAPPARPSTQTAPKKTNSDSLPYENAAQRAGSIAAPNAPQSSPVAGTSAPSAPANRIEIPHSAPQSAARTPVAPPSVTAKPYRPLLGTSLLDNDEPSHAAAKPEPSAAASGPAVSSGNRIPQAAQIADFGPPPSQPIQNRLMQSRTSAFKTTAPTEPRPAAGSSNAPAVADSPSVDERIARQASISGAQGTRAADRPTPASRPTIAAQATPADQPTPAKRPAVSAPANRPALAQRTSPNVREKSDGATSSLPQAASASNPARTANPPHNAKDDGLLFTRRGPVLSVETLGPRKIIVGKESTYEVELANSGEVAAEELIVFVSLPEWAEVANADASTGTPQLATPGQSAAAFQWKVGRLEAKSKEKLSLKIIPRQSKPFDLVVRWDYKPVASQAMIEVQEPKLEMQLEGPRDVFYGKKETYRLKMMNAGTGDAEGVVVKLMPIGSGENVPATYQLGVLPAGESKNIDIELTARQAGELSIQVEAKGDAGIHAELTERVLVRRAGLEVIVEGPRLQYVGATGTYLIRVRNPGNAPAANIRFSAALPAGMKYIGGIEGVRADAEGAKLQWILESLNPQLEQVYSMKCRLGAAGTARLDVAAAAEDELTTAAGASTQVDAAASLALDVQDPPGPVSLGDEAIYEVRVRNRGTKIAEGVEVLSYFSRGIEPIAAEGGPNRIGPGQVAFAPLATLAPGAEIVFKVRAKAETAGNHVFRAEVHCKAMGTRLISEKNTLYYQDRVTQETPDANAPVEANRYRAVPENYRTQRQ
ncbi:MAG: hypothetical protein IT426_12080 [Pirellulales bacterium]|nr:hypothetical protein [Pirellulales bacterium]